MISDRQTKIKIKINVITMTNNDLSSSLMFGILAVSNKQFIEKMNISLIFSSVLNWRSIYLNDNCSICFQPQVLLKIRMTFEMDDSNS